MPTLSTTSNWDRFVQKQPFDGGCEGPSIEAPVFFGADGNPTPSLYGRAPGWIVASPECHREVEPIEGSTETGRESHSRVETRTGHKTGSMQRLFLVCDSCRETTVQRHPWEAWSFAPSQSRALPAPWLGALVWTRAGPPKRTLKRKGKVAPKRCMTCSPSRGSGAEPMA